MAGRESPPSVSAIIPAYNAEAYIREAIDSVLAQTQAVSECVVVDDGSTDATAQLAAVYGPPVRVIRQENRGVAAARNRGAGESTGELLAFLDADDRWHPDRVALQVSALEAAPQAEAVVCATQVGDSELRPVTVIAQRSDVTLEDVLLCRAELVSVSSNLLVRRSTYNELGGFDERLSTSADWALNFRLIERGTLVAIRTPLVDYRVHGANMSSSVERFERDMLTAFDGVFESRPQLGGLRRRAYANLHRMIAGSYFVDRRLGPFAAHAARSIGYHPSTLPYFLGMPVRRLRRRA